MKKLFKMMMLISVLAVCAQSWAENGLGQLGHVGLRFYVNGNGHTLSGALEQLLQGQIDWENFRQALAPQFYDSMARLSWLDSVLPEFGRELQIFLVDPIAFMRERNAQARLRALRDVADLLERFSVGQPADPGWGLAAMRPYTIDGALGLIQRGLEQGAYRPSPLLDELVYALRLLHAWYAALPGGETYEKINM